jgi:Tfp pilus assembly protein PilP
VAQKETVAKAVAAPKVAVAKPAETKVVVAKVPDAKPVPVAAKAEPKQQAKTVVAAKAAPAVSAPLSAPVKTAEAPKAEEKKWAMNGKRDPFFSPVVQQGGSGCSTGKKCLEIGAINLRGVIKSDSGFIAVVTNNMNKAYFLRENDPVFNGYVVKITGDSVTFQETVQDKLGKTFTREVVKKIFTPAV